MISPQTADIFLILLLTATVIVLLYLKGRDGEDF
jgi:hypothetical protein